ncbi:hypothetical protein Tco_0666822 [Tanacetum coccineum]
MIAETPSSSNPKAQAAEKSIKVAIHPEYPQQALTIGENLSEQGKVELCKLLKKNLDIFAWKPADMTGVLRYIAEHRLNTKEGYLLVRQKKRGQAPDRNKAIHEEVKKLVEAGIMRENVGDTYQRLMDKAFEKQVGWNLEVVKKGMFLGHVVSTEGIRACPDKAATVLDLPSLRTLKEVQRLNGRLASLRRFMSKSAEKALPFFKTLKGCIKKRDFLWNPEAEKEFK